PLTIILPKKFGESPVSVSTPLPALVRSPFPEIPLEKLAELPWVLIVLAAAIPKTLVDDRPAAPIRSRVPSSDSIPPPLTDPLNSNAPSPVRVRLRPFWLIEPLEDSVVPAFTTRHVWLSPKLRVESKRIRSPL